MQKSLSGPLITSPLIGNGMSNPSGNEMGNRPEYLQSWRLQSDVRHKQNLDQSLECGLTFEFTQHEDDSR